MSLVHFRKRKDLTHSRAEPGGSFGRFLDSEWDRNLPSALRRATIPLVSVVETPRSWTFGFELGGLRATDVHVRLDGRQLVVSGERTGKAEQGKQPARRGACERSIELPDDARLEPDRLDASFEHGVLEVSVSKLEPIPG